MMLLEHSWHHYRAFRWRVYLLVLRGAAVQSPSKTSLVAGNAFLLMAIIHAGRNFDKQVKAEWLKTSSTAPFRHGGRLTAANAPNRQMEQEPS